MCLDLTMWISVRRPLSITGEWSGVSEGLTDTESWVIMDLSELVLLSGSDYVNFIGSYVLVNKLFVLPVCLDEWEWCDDVVDDCESASSDSERFIKLNFFGDFLFWFWILMKLSIFWLTGNYYRSVDYLDK